MHFFSSVTNYSLINNFWINLSSHSSMLSYLSDSFSLNRTIMSLSEPSYWPPAILLENINIFQIPSLNNNLRVLCCLGCIISKIGLVLFFSFVGLLQHPWKVPSVQILYLFKQGFGQNFNLQCLTSPGCFAEFFFFLLVSCMKDLPGNWTFLILLVVHHFSLLNTFFPTSQLVFFHFLNL